MNATKTRPDTCALVRLRRDVFLRAKAALGSRYEFKLDGVWAQRSTVDHSTLDPRCDVIPPYSATRIQSGGDT